MPTTPGSELANLGPQLVSTLGRGLLLLVAIAFVLAAVAVALRSKPLVRLANLSVRWLGSAGSEPAMRRTLRIGLGLLWLVDGMLQAQPKMPAGFVARVIAPGMSESPHWLGNLVSPLARDWLHHPVAADAITVWIQVGLGVLILSSGRDGWLARASLWASIVWSAVVWVSGEFLGGVLGPGSSWLMGSPGAAVLYAVAAGLLLAPRERWSTGFIARTARQVAGGWLLLGAVFQAIPWERNWTAAGLVAPFQGAADNVHFGVLARPIRATATLAATYPVELNLAITAALVVIGAGLWIWPSKGFVVAGLVLCALTWWLAQGFGVLGGLGTDPNTAVPLALLLVTGRPIIGVNRGVEKSFEARTYTAATSRSGAVRVAFTTGVSAVGVGALVVIPLVLAVSVLRPADATAALADSGGGFVALGQRPAAPFSLTDQTGLAVSLSSARGKLVILTFLDPVCSDDCPIIANQLAAVDRQLGALANRLEILAIDSNPIFHNVADVAAFTRSHGLADLQNWHYLAGSEPALREALDSYGMSVQVPTVGMIAHSEGMFFVSDTGLELEYLGDGANPDLGKTYTDLIGDEVRKILR
ncbi:MAG TPA: SCO family protein [Jatrophihabitans sp.]|jgi:cytochrome oxidase Cu insertion factor (SCO1/SenC/PrrC family)